MNQTWPVDHLFAPDDPTNVIANASFDAGGSGPLPGWTLIEGSVEREPRDGGACLRLNGRVLSNRFEMPAHTPYELTGEASGNVTFLLHVIEHDRYLRAERYEHTSADWTAFAFPFLPPPNAERCELEIVSDCGLVDNLRLDGLGAREYNILDSQAGYHPEGSKRVLVRSRQELTEAVRWELIDTLRGTTAAEDELEPAGRDPWGRWMYVADCTPCRRTGNYLLRVHFAEQIVESGVIRVRSDVYRDLAQTVAKYSYLQRCGTDIPGYHKACHLNDALIRKTKQGSEYGEVVEYRDLTGGWHDAGDYNKWFHYFGYVLETLALMHERLDLPQQTYGGDIPDVLSEVFWGADFFLKVQNPDGSFLGAICTWFTEDAEEPGKKKNSPWAIFWEDPHEDSGRGSVMNPRSRGVTYDDQLPNPVQVLDYSTALAMASRAAAGTDDARAWTYANAALRSVDWILGEQPELASHPYFATLWYALYRGTGKREYRGKALAMIPALLGKQLGDGSFGPTGGLKHSFHHITALMELIVDEPDLKERTDILTAAERYLDWLDGYVLRDSGYDLVLQPVADSKPGVLTGKTLGRNAYIGNAAYVYALAGRLTGRTDWLARAEEQVAWLLGRNPHGVCQMVDAGRVHAGRYHGYTNLNDNDLRGAITGGIINGIEMPSEGESTWTTMPPRFPVLSVRRTDVPYSDHHFQNARHDTNEYWSLHHAGFHQAVSALGAAYADTPARSIIAYLYGTHTGYEAAREFDPVFDAAGWDADRIPDDVRYPHFDVRAYGAVVVGPSWRGPTYVDAKAFGITARQAFLRGVPWIFVGATDEALAWLEEESGGLAPYETLPKPEPGWDSDEQGQVRRIAASNIHRVPDAEALAALLKRYGEK